MSNSSAGQPRAEAQRLLQAFEAEIAVFKRAESDATYEVGPLSGDRYAQFRARAGDLHALAIVVRSRVDKVAAADPALGERFARALVAAEGVFISNSLRYLGVLSEHPALPLGAREIFTGELRSLYGAREQLRDPRLEPHIDDALRRQIATAEQVLEIIIDKAPQLLSFDTR